MVGDLVKLSSRCHAGTQSIGGQSSDPRAARKSTNTGIARSGRRCRPDEVAAVRVVVESPNSSLAAPAVSNHGAAVDCAEVDTGRVVRPVLVLNRLALSPVVAVEDGDRSVVRELPLARRESLS